MVWKQQTSITDLRQHNQQLQEQLDRGPAAVDSPAKDGALDETELRSLAESTRELPKLRNEVRELREERRTVDTLKTENERLAATLKAARKAAPRRISEAEGFVVREKWAHAGFATPEATVQTLFRAIANKDFATLAECSAGKARENFQRKIGDPASANRLEEKFDPLTRMQGFKIAEKKQISETRIELAIQAASGGRTMPMRLELVNGEWKLSD